MVNVILYRLSHIDTDVRMVFYCPGCKREHAYRIQEADKPVGGGPIWSWNGSYEKPTFSPSLLNHEVKADPGDPHPEFALPRCHLFINNGMIDYCGDCTHELAGRQVPMVDVDLNMRGT